MSVAREIKTHSLILKEVFVCLSADMEQIHPKMKEICC